MVDDDISFLFMEKNCANELLIVSCSLEVT